MNNLHRELAPISEAAWFLIEEETSRHHQTLSCRSARRRRAGPKRCRHPRHRHWPFTQSGGAGRWNPCTTARGQSARRTAHSFRLERQQIDDVERGANNSDWQPAKDAAPLLAFAEDRAIFEGYAAAGIGGIREGTSNPVVPLPADIRAYPNAIAQALSQLRLVGVNGPYSVLLSANAYTGLSETSDHGYPVMDHIKRLVDGQIIWAPAISGAFVLTTRGGDFGLYIGEDVSIGYLSHDDKMVRLYLEETFTFLLLTTEASVALIGPETKTAT